MRGQVTGNRLQGTAYRGQLTGCPEEVQTLLPGCLGTVRGVRFSPFDIRTSTFVIPCNLSPLTCRLP
jgi:hypothetical protein